jgi:hypothetical protein
MTKEEIESKLIKELEDKKTFLRGVAKEYDKADMKEAAVNAFLVSESSAVVKIYTEQLLGREMSWGTFKEYMLSNIDDMNIVTILSILIDESMKEDR